VVRHDEQWLGESQRLVVDDARRALHAVWTHPMWEHGEKLARILHARAQLPPR
jgi:hypothetical protein